MCSTVSEQASSTAANLACAFVSFFGNLHNRMLLPYYDSDMVFCLGKALVIEQAVGVSFMLRRHHTFSKERQAFRDSIKSLSRSGRDRGVLNSILIDMNITLEPQYMNF